MFKRLSWSLTFFVNSLTLFGQALPNLKKERVGGDTDFEKLPSLHWKFKSRGPVFSTPVISGDVIYVGSLDSTVYAIKLNSGKLQWKLKTGGEIRSTVCLDGDQLFVYSGDATLYSIHKISGKVLWTFKTKGGILGDRRYDFADYYQSSPVIQNGRIYFGAGDSRVYALNKKNGMLDWSFKTNGIVHTTPALYKDRLIVGSFDGTLYALSQDRGDLLWKFKTVGHHFFPEGEVQGSPVVSNDIVYFGARDYNLYAIDAINGYAHWNRSFLNGWAMAVTPRDSVIYVGTSDDRVLVALEAVSGKELWRADVKFNIFGPGVYSASMLYVGTLMGKLFGIDVKDGKVKWVFTTESYDTNHLKYFKPDDTFRDDIMNFIKTPADFISMEYALGAIFSTPAISDNHMVIGSTDGTIYCLKK